MEAGRSPRTTGAAAVPKEGPTPGPPHTGCDIATHTVSMTVRPVAHPDASGSCRFASRPALRRPLMSVNRPRARHHASQRSTRDQRTYAGMCALISLHPIALGRAEPTAAHFSVLPAAQPLTLDSPDYSSGRPGQWLEATLAVRTSHSRSRNAAVPVQTTRHQPSSRRSAPCAPLPPRLPPSLLSTLLSRRAVESTQARAWM